MPWYNCRVARAGPAENGVIYVSLQDRGGAFPARWFEALATMKGEMLSTALAALTTGFSVDIALDSTVEYSVIQRMYLVSGDPALTGAAAIR